MRMIINTMVLCGWIICASALMTKADIVLVRLFVCPSAQD